MKEANRTQITETICKQAQLMRKGGANQTEIGKLLGVNPCTISRIEKAGFDMAKYQASRRLEKQKEKAAKAVITVRAEDIQAAMSAEEQVPGQLQMDLTPEKPEMSDQTKLMRFQAHMTDDVKKTIIDMIAMVTVNQNKLYDMVCQLLRAVRKD